MILFYRSPNKFVISVSFGTNPTDLLCKITVCDPSQLTFLHACGVIKINVNFMKNYDSPFFFRIRL